MKRCPLRWLFKLSLAVVILASPVGVLGATDESAPGHFVEVEKGKIYYEECGTGPDAIVLIHDGIAQFRGLGCRLARILQRIPHGAL
jgi:hypothetical protein